MTHADRGQSGFTLVELLLVMTLALVLMGATLTTFTTMERGARDNQRLNDAQMQARVATDTLAKRLRNLASPADPTGAITTAQPIERALPQDIVFRTVNSEGSPTTANPQNVERYRYCLADDGKLYSQRQTDMTQAMPATAECPGSGWPESKVVAENLVNGTRPVFRYQVVQANGSFSELTSVASASFSDTIALRSELFVDPKPTSPPQPTTLTTRVFLRNQNRPPVASFSVTVTGGGQKPSLVLNASASDDPEGTPLHYRWLFDDQVLATGTSAVHSFKPTTTVGTHTITLEVTDVGGLRATASRTVYCTTTTSCTPQ